MKHEKLNHSSTYMPRSTLVQTLKTIRYKKNNNALRNSSKTTRKYNKQNINNPSPGSFLSKMINSKTSNEGSVKRRYDELMNQLFMKIDFDCSGFITGTKIAYYKQMPQTIYYFLGGVFQKVRQLGTVTFKMFESLCNEQFIQASAKDIDAIFACTSFSTKKYNKIEESRDSRSKVRISLNKNRCKTDNLERQSYTQSQVQFFTRKIEKSNHSLKKYSLKLNSRQSQLIQQKDHKAGKNNRKSLDKKLNYSMEKDSSGYQNVSFQSQKLKILTQRLNRQIEQSSQRLYKNRLID